MPPNKGNNPHGCERFFLTCFFKALSAPPLRLFDRCWSISNSILVMFAFRWARVGKALPSKLSIVKMGRRNPEGTNNVTNQFCSTIQFNSTCSKSANRCESPERHSAPTLGSLVGIWVRLGTLIYVRIYAFKLHSIY